MKQSEERREGGDRRSQRHPEDEPMSEEVRAVLRLVGDLRSSDAKTSWWSKWTRDRRKVDRRRSSP